MANVFMEKNKKRIDLLSQAEIEDLYERPAFNDEERLLLANQWKEEARERSV